MTEHHPHRHAHAYLPAAGHDAFLPGYDLMTRVARMNRTYDALIGQAQLRTGLRVLDIGCGTGNVTLRAKRLHPAAELVGIDPDPLALQRARSKGAGTPGLRFDQGYVQELPYRDGEFDRVLSSAMFHHLDPEVKSRALDEVFRVLRPAGSLHLVDFVGGHGGLLGFLLRRNPHLHDTADSVMGLLSAAGFDAEVVAVKQHWLFGALTFFRAVHPA